MTGQSTHRVRRRPRRGHEVYPHTGVWDRLDASELEALPIGTRRTIILNGVWLTVKRKDNGWTISHRHRIPSVALAGRWSVDMPLAAPPGS